MLVKISVLLGLLVNFIACGSNNRLEHKAQKLLDSPVMIWGAGKDQVVSKFEQELEKDNYNFLSQSSKSNLTNLVKKRVDKRKKINELCKIEPVLDQKILNKINTIRENQDLNYNTKKSQVLTILEDLEPRFNAKRTKMKSCRQEKNSELRKIKQEFYDMSQSCLGDDFFAKKGNRKRKHKKRGRKHGFGKGGLLSKISHLDQEKKIKLDKNLASTDCSNKF